MARAESRTVELNYRADISQLKNALAEMPEITAKEAKKMVQELDRQLKRTEKAVKRTGKQGAKSFKQFANSAGDSERALIGVSDLLDKVSPAAAGVVRGFADIGGGLESIVKGGGALGPVALGVGAVTLAVTGLAGGMALAVGATDDALDSLEGFREIGSDFYPEVPAATLASIKAANASVDALGSVAGSLTVTLGANLAPAVEQVANVAVALALRADDAFESFMEGREVVRELAEFMVSRFADALLFPIQPVKLLAEGIQLLSQVSGVELPGAAGDAINALGDLESTIAAGVIDFAEEKLAASSLGDALSDLSAEGAAFIAVQQQATAADNMRADALKSTSAAARDAEKATADLNAMTEKLTASSLEGYAKINFELGQQLETIDELIAAGGDLEAAEAARAAAMETSNAAVAELGASLSREMAAAEADALEVADSIEESFRSIALNAPAFMGDVFGNFVAATQMLLGEALNQSMDLISANSEAFSKLSEEEREAKNKQFQEEQAQLKEGALKLFRAEKAAAISSAIMSGAVAVLRALEQLGPVAGGIAAAGIAATTAAQVAVIAAQPPPTFHRGGGPDEINAVLRRGEGVLTQQGAAAVGGDAGIAALNRGESSSSRPIKVEFNVGSRVSQAILIDAQRAPGPGRRATRSSRPTGRRNPYGDR